MYRNLELTLLERRETEYDELGEALDRVFGSFRSIRKNNKSAAFAMAMLVEKWENAQFNSLEGLNEGKICNNCRDEVEEKTIALELRVEELEKENNLLTETIRQLEKQGEIMAYKLKNSLPYHSIAFACVTLFGFSCFLILYLLQLIKGIYLIHPFITFSGMIGSLGLLLTALLSMKDWKEWLLENEKK